MFKTTKGLPTAAVVLGLLLAASPTLAGPGRREGRPGGMGGDLRRALAALDLTEDQKTKMKELFENGRQRRETLRQEGRTAREALRAAAGAAAPDPAAVGAAFLRLKAHREALRTERESARTSLEALLTPEQKAKLDGWRAARRASGVRLAGPSHRGGRQSPPFVD